jgi:cobalamin biosynthesis Mg chelatase CobN
MAAHDPDAAPAGEELHLPDPSLIPILNAAGVALALVGLTITYYLTAVGGLLLLVTLVIWIRDVTHDISELPADHRSAH